VDRGGEARPGPGWGLRPVAGILSGLIFLAALTGPARAAPAALAAPAAGSAAIQKVEREIDKDEDQLRRIEARLALARDRDAKGRLRTESLLLQLDRLSARLAVEDQRFRLLARKVRRSEIRHGQIRGKFQKLRDKQEGRRLNLRARLRALYMGGSAGSVRLIVMSRSMWDLMDRWALVARLARHDQQLLGRYRAAEQRLRRLEAAAAEEVERRKKLKERQARAKGRVARYYSRRSRRLALLEKNKARRKVLMGELENSRDAMRDAIASLMKVRDSKIDRNAAMFDKLEGRLPWPVRGEPRPEDRAGGSRGIRIHAPRDAPVQSVAPGEVVYSDWVRGYGRLLILRHGEGVYTVYGGARKVLVERGQKVAGGQVIARVGATGVMGIPALYFEIRRGSIPLDPLRWLSPRR